MTSNLDRDDLYPYNVYDVVLDTDAERAALARAQDELARAREVYFARTAAAVAALRNRDIAGARSAFLALLRLAAPDDTADADNPLARDTPDMRALADAARRAQTTIDERVSTHPVVTQFVRDVASRYTAARATLERTLSAVAGAPVSLAADANVAAYATVADTVMQFYTRMIAAFADAATAQDVNAKYDRINSEVTPRLVAAMLFAGLLFKSSTRSALHVADMWNTVLARVVPELQILAELVRTNAVDERRVVIPQFLEAMHGDNTNNVLGINARIRRYLADLGVTDVQDAPRVRALTQADVAEMSDLHRIRHYTRDLYQTYRLIARDTVLYQFRASARQLPDGLATEWTKRMESALDRLPSVETFLDELFFTNVAALIDAPHRDRVAQYLNTAPRLTPETRGVLRTAIGDTQYVNILRAIAIDTDGDTPRLRTETLLQYLAQAANDNLNTKTTAEVDTSDTYRAIVNTTDMIATRLVDMSPLILTVFQLINVYRNEYLDEVRTDAADVLTFVKIRNDNRMDYGNRRFDIWRDAQNTTMMIRYEHQEESCYDPKKIAARVKAAKAKAKKAGGAPDVSDAIAKDEREALAKNEIMRDFLREQALRKRTGGAAAKPATPKRATVGNPAAKPAPVMPATVAQPPGEDAQRLDASLTPGDKSYVARGPRSTYVFGPFTRVYMPNETAADIASEKRAASSATVDKTIVERLRTGRDVCIFGYGQSGSGKTSLLIYHKTGLDDSGEMGIMSMICDRLQRDYRYLEVEIREIGITTPGSKRVDVLGDAEPFYQTKRFVPSRVESNGSIHPDSMWTLDPETALPVLERNPPPPAGSDESREVNPEKLRALGSYVYFATENKRLTKGTTNNPTSSRSHILVFIRFREPRNSAARESCLVIGDFAGVENRFDCGDLDVLKQFSKVSYGYAVNDRLVYTELVDREYAKTVMPLVTDSRFTGLAYNTMVQTYTEQADKTAKSPETDYFTGRTGTLASRAEKAFDSMYRDAASAVAKNTFADTRLAREIKAICEMSKFFRTDKEYAAIVADVKKVDDKFSRAFRGINFFNSVFKAHGDWANAMRHIVGVPDKAMHVPDNELNFEGSSQEAKITATVIMRDVFTAPQNGLSLADTYLFLMLRSTAAMFMSNECADRVDEGDFINASLGVFRKFLSNTLRRKGAVPKTLGQCAAIQCNPFYNDCFGSLYTDTSTVLDEIEETFAKMLCRKTEFDTTPDGSFDKTSPRNYQRAMECLEQLTFCVFNVINISKARNDPPPVPFIDTNRLAFEYNRFASAATKIGIDSLGTALDTFPRDVLVDLRTRTSPAECKTLSGTIRDQVTRRIDDTLKIVDANKSREEILAAVHSVMDEYDKINAPTLLGTMIFTDSIAKFGLNRMMCVLDSDNGNASPGSGDGFVDRLAYGRVADLRDTVEKFVNRHLYRASDK